MSDKSIRLILETLSCTKTTEAAEDEVYLAVGGRNTKKGEFSSVAPSSDNPWNMNDSGDLQTRDLYYVIYSGVIPDQSTTDIDVLFLERDGGTPKAALNTAAALAAAVSNGNPYVLAAAGVAKVLAEVFGILGIKDTDDWLGGFHLTVTNTNGKVRLNWRAGERSEIFTKAQASKTISNLEAEYANAGAFAKLRIKPVLDYYKSIEARCGKSNSSDVQRIMAYGDGSTYSAFLKAEIL